MVVAERSQLESRPATILLVEDDPFQRTSTADLLREAGYSVVETGSAGEATNVLSSGTSIEVVFSDVSLPGAMGGLSLVIWIHNRYPTIPVVLTSGLKAVIPTLSQQVAVPFLTKPYSSDELLGLINRLISERSPRFWSS
jgi:two-component system, response regulator PdtaR